MKKKIIALLAAASMLVTGQALAAEDTVEITFSVGDSVLTVNGEPLEVTAPYVVGDGTTLVPVRVITEAFGAEVNWDGDTQSVNLKYPDVDITIQIGSKSATVNSHTEELAAAPELYNDTTMVPLRFISETFGAEVGYEEATQRITVTKSTSEDDASTVEGMTDAEYIGDSYFGWQIRNPKTLIMDDRSFDGEYTVFTDGGDKCRLRIGINVSDEDIDVDEEYNDLKDIMALGTISAADRDTLSDGTVKIHFRGKDRDTTYDAVEYVKGNMAYYALADADNDYEELNDLLALNGTFTINASGDFYDLSNVEDGYRYFYDEDYKVSMKIPAEWSQIEGDVTNEFHFVNEKDDMSALNLEIFSKSDKVSAQKMAESDRDSHAYTGNPDIAIVSEVEHTGDRYNYTVEYQGGGSSNYTYTDVFFENGDYVYNIAVQAKTFDEANRLIDGVDVETLDSSVIGTLLRESDLGTGTTEKSISGGKVTVSDMWTSYLPNTLIDRRTGGMFMVTYNGGSNGRLKQVTEALAKSIRDDGDKIVKPVSSKRVNGTSYYSFTAEQKDKDSGEIRYATVYTVAIGNKDYMFVHTRKDIYYGGGVDTEAEEMVYSFTVK